MDNEKAGKKSECYNEYMHMKRAQIWILVIVTLSFCTVFSGYLKTEDVSFPGYLSGLMLQVWGGEEGQLIRVNLHNHEIALYQGGMLYKLARIAGTGNPYDSTATPVGNFRILSKDKRHISSQHVIMPLSLRFSNKGYYFHDIPLTMAGVRINTVYSHGCIRLPTPLAEEMFNWTHVGAYVEIYDTYLARAAGSNMVYLLTKDGQRTPILTEAEFVTKGYKWGDVAVVPADELNGLPLTETKALGDVK